jgi:apolipoprotein D and lipocalin family protein
MRIVLMLMMVMTAVGAAASDRSPLETVSAVDLDRYLGTWYEIASYPAWFQRDCTATTAEYSRRVDSLIRVVNSCRKGSLSGRLDRSTGRAKVVEGSGNAKLRVSFFWPFWGDYWIIDLDPDYRWAVVGEPKRDYLWILSRTPTMDESVYEAVVARLAAKGYDPAGLVRTIQPTSDSP